MHLGDPQFPVRLPLNVAWSISARPGQELETRVATAILFQAGIGGTDLTICDRTLPHWDPTNITKQHKCMFSTYFTSRATDKSDGPAVRFALMLWNAMVDNVALFRAPKLVALHFKETSISTRGGSGVTQKEIVTKQLAKAMRHVRCQRSFLHGQHSSCFEVYTPDLTISVSTVFSMSIAAEVRSELAMLEEQKRRHGQVMHDSVTSRRLSVRKLRSVNMLSRSCCCYICKNVEKTSASLCQLTSSSTILPKIAIGGASFNTTRICSGQPARETEILSIRHMNTVHGHHRNIFIENGMVSTVTSYHKGYNVTGSTKIIHRYLPKKVGELPVYYLWLILPFCQQLELLAFRNSAQTSPFYRLRIRVGTPGTVFN
jgi:hypothetical protein